MAPMRSPDRIEQCLNLEAKRKTSARTEYFAFSPKLISIIQLLAHGGRRPIWCAVPVKRLRLGHLLENAPYEIGIAIDAAWLQ